MNPTKLSAPLFLAVALSPGLSFAAMTITFDEVGSDVVATYSGSVDLASVVNPASQNLPAVHDYDGDEASFRNYGTTGTTTVTLATTNFITSPSFVTAGGGAPQVASSFAGQDFGVLSSVSFQQIFLPSGYTSGSSIDGSMTFANTDIATLGLNPGSYLWSWTSGATDDSATFVVVPEPSSVAMLALSALALGRRRR